MILIASGAYVISEFQVELGKIPPCLLPIGNKKLLELQVSALRKTFNNQDIYLSLPESYELSSSENKIKLEQIEDVLNKCGTTKVYTHKHQAFNAGKTEFDDHKEYLFITKVDNEKRNSSFSTILCGR